MSTQETKSNREFNAFSALVSKVLSISKDEMSSRETEYRKKVDANPNRRGPKRGSKRKTKSSASPDPAETPLA
jgi:hypothetical protein